MIEHNYDGLFIGEVISSNRLTREIEVNIPKLMSLLPPSDYRIERKVKVNRSPSLVVNGTTPRENILTSNFITAKALNRSEAMPEVGSKVMILFLEGNFNKPFWREFIISDEYEVIEAEKYRKLYNVKVGQHQVELYEEDILEIEIPEGFSVHKKEEGKVKKYTLTRRENYVISRESPFEPFTGMQWYDLSSGKIKIYKGGNWVTLSEVVK